LCFSITFIDLIFGLDWAELFNMLRRFCSMSNYQSGESMRNVVGSALVTSPLLENVGAMMGNLRFFSRIAHAYLNNMKYGLFSYDSYRRIWCDVVESGFDLFQNFWWVNNQTLKCFRVVACWYDDPIALSLPSLSLLTKKGKENRIKWDFDMMARTHKILMDCGSLFHFFYSFKPCFINTCVCNKVHYKA